MRAWAAARESPEISIATNVLGTAPRQRDGLSPNAASDLQHHTSGWIERIGVQKLGERVGLIGEAFPLAARVSVDVVLPGAHGRYTPHRAQLGGKPFPRSRM